MNSFEVQPGISVKLSGTPFERGRQQAECSGDLVYAVCKAVRGRLRDCAEIMRRTDVQDLLRNLESFHRKRDPEIMEEIAGISAGFKFEPAEIFAYLNSSLALDYAVSLEGGEECTSFAVTKNAGGSFVAKNRDYRLEHISIQKVFHHSDPSWGGRKILCVGSLGSPGNFSSGMNSDGFAVADTASRVRRYGVGCHRYFLLTRLLVRCASVGEALAEIADTRHAGGGTLTLGDATGAIAVVELGHEAQSADVRRFGWLARTNHFVSEQLAATTQRLPRFAKALENSEARLATVRERLGDFGGEWGFEKLATILAYRGESGGTALCRETESPQPNGDSLSQTISGVIYDTCEKRIWFSSGYPSRDEWSVYGFDEKV